MEKIEQQEPNRKLGITSGAPEVSDARSFFFFFFFNITDFI
jgi:hypothetical protein